jgi:hypothetical protein
MGWGKLLKQESGDKNHLFSAVTWLVASNINQYKSGNVSPYVFSNNIVLVARMQQQQLHASH